MKKSKTKSNKAKKKKKIIKLKNILHFCYLKLSFFFLELRCYDLFKLFFLKLYFIVFFFYF